MDVVNGNTLENPTIVNQSPATDLRSEKTANSPQLNYDIGEDRDGRRIYKIYQFPNCRTVYMDSFNSQSVTMENCANNNVRRVTHHRASELNSDDIRHSQSHAAVNGLLTDSPRARKTYISFSLDCVVIFSCASLAVACLAFFITNSPRFSSCGIVERT
ncbi:hypothetical protein BYT27DRAFT_7188047 [Phlegmacium glaucopus]|nr:hypothetical protein BYT27DRAFT_7188047 [Phlegmacium glaucopus]